MNNDFFININHIKVLQEVQFNNVLNMDIPEWIISPIDAEVECINLDIFLKEQFTKMTFNCNMKSVYIFKGTGYYWMNKKRTNKIFQFLCNYWVIFQVHIWWNLGLSVCIIYKANREALWMSNMVICCSNSQSWSLIFVISSESTKHILPIKNNSKFKQHLLSQFTDSFFM